MRNSNTGNLHACVIAFIFLSFFLINCKLQNGKFMAVVKNKISEHHTFNPMIIYVIQQRFLKIAFSGNIRNNPLTSQLSDVLPKVFLCILHLGVIYKKVHQYGHYDLTYIQKYIHKIL